MWRETTATAPAPTTIAAITRSGQSGSTPPALPIAISDAEPDDPGDADRCCGAAHGPAATVRDAAEERDAQGRSDVGGCDRVDAAADRVAGRRVDER